MDFDVVYNNIYIESSNKINYNPNNKLRLVLSKNTTLNHRLSSSSRQ
jgi:hypothetical protein